MEGTARNGKGLTRQSINNLDYLGMCDACNGHERRRGERTGSDRQGLARNGLRVDPQG